MTSKRQRQEAAGQWLRRERERRGLQTAGALARRMGVSDSLISRIETGATSVTDERAEQIAEAFGMNVIEVRRNLGLWVPPAGEHETEALLAENERMARLLALARELNERDQQVVEDLISSLRRSQNPDREGNSVG